MNWIQGDAEALPFADKSFHAVTMAFGIRNCTHVDRVLSEAYRVLAPGGRFLCLEFSRVDNDALRRLDCPRFRRAALATLPHATYVTASTTRTH